MFGKRCLFAAMIAAVCMFMGCTEIYDQETSIVISTSKEFSVIINDIYIKVSPTTVTLGKEVSIDVTHENGDTVDVVISSKSLEFKEHVTTPYHTKMKMDVVGTHDLSFTIGTGSMVTVGTTTNINVEE